MSLHLVVIVFLKLSLSAFTIHVLLVQDKIFCKNAFEFLSLDEKLYNCESISAHKMNFHLVNNSSHETMYALEQQHWGNFCTCL